MENMDFDFFSEEIKESEIEKISISDYVYKTKKLLSDIQSEYSKCWITSKVSDCDIQSSCDCDNCKGTCIVVKNNKEYECLPDSEYGECFIREFDDELFSDFMEEKMFGCDSSFFELLYSDVE